MAGNNHSFTTPDVPLTAYLIQQGYNLLTIEYPQIDYNSNNFPKRKKQAIFVFNNSPELQNHVNLYSRGEAVINLAIYEHTRASLLDRIKGELP